MLSKSEKRIISAFLKNLDKYDNETMILTWSDGSKVIASFETCFEDSNEYDLDDEKYEEFISFAFTAQSTEGHPPVFITEDSGFLISYHNFPDEIIADGKKIGGKG